MANTNKHAQPDQPDHAGHPGHAGSSAPAASARAPDNADAKSHAAYARVAHYSFDDRGTDTVAVLLHGLGGDYHQPLGLTDDALQSTGISVLAPDARAHGQTMVVGPPEQFTNQALSEDLLALVDHQGLRGKRLILIGISMGAAIALHTARHHGDRIGGVVLIRPSFEASPWPPHLRVFQEIASLLRAEAAEGVSRFVLGLSYQEMRLASASAAASLVEQFTKPLAVERVVRLETVPGNVSIDWTGELELPCPVTVVAATKDPGHPVHVAELWHQRLAPSTLVRVVSRDERPAQYAAELAKVVTDCVNAWL